MRYRCWTVKRKTVGCGVYLTLDLIVQVEEYRYTLLLLPPLAPSNMTCCECNASPTYIVADVEERSVDDPCLTKPCSAFLNAVAHGVWHGSDTAGFSDAGGNAVAGVFWHSAGYIIDRNGRRRGAEPDAPGCTSGTKGRINSGICTGHLPRWPNPIITSRLMPCRSGDGEIPGPSARSASLGLSGSTKLLRSQRPCEATLGWRYIEQISKRGSLINRRQGRDHDSRVSSHAGAGRPATWIR